MHFICLTREMTFRIAFNQNTLLNLRLQPILVRRRLASATPVEDFNITSADEKPIFEDKDKEISEEIQEKRDKSRLNPQHKNILRGRVPYNECITWYHHTVKYKRQLLGKYGIEAVGVPAGFAWPTIEEVEEAKEYERVAFPLTLQERWSKLEEKRQEEAAATKAREDNIVANLAKLNTWKVALRKKLEVKEKQLAAAQAAKERILKEVKRHFGYNVPEHDERFKEMVLIKEKEERKKKKEMKKQMKAQWIQQKIKETEASGQTSVSNILPNRETESTKSKE